MHVRREVVDFDALVAMEEEGSSTPHPPDTHESSGTRKASERTTPNSDEQTRLGRSFENPTAFTASGDDAAEPRAGADGPDADTPVARALARTMELEEGRPADVAGTPGASGTVATPGQKSTASLTAFAGQPAPANPDALDAAAERPSGSGAGSRTTPDPDPDPEPEPGSEPDSDTDSDSDYDSELELEAEADNEYPKNPDITRATSLLCGGEFSDMRKFVCTLYGHASEWLFTHDDGFANEAWTERSMAKWKLGGNEEFKTRLSEVKLILKAVILAGKKVGSDTSRAEYERHFPGASVDAHLDKLPQVRAPAYTEYVCREGSTTLEQDATKKLVKVAVEDFIAKDGDVFNFFVVEKLTCGAKGLPHFVFVEEPDPTVNPQAMRWRPGKSPIRECLASYKGTPYETALRSKGARENERPPAHVTRIFRNVLGVEFNINDFTIKVDADADDTTILKQPSPYLPVLFRVVVGTDTVRRMVPPERNGRGTEVSAYNALHVTMKRARLAAPIDSVVASLRAMPAWIGGVPASTALGESSIKGNDKGMPILPKPGTPPTLRDKIQTYLLLRDLALTNVGLLALLENADLVEQRDVFPANPQRGNYRRGHVGGSNASDSLLFAAFDSFGVTGQLTLLSQLCVVLEHAWPKLWKLKHFTIVAEACPSLRLCYVASIRRMIEQTVATNARENTDREPPRRRMYALTMLGLSKIGSRHLRTFHDVSPSVVLVARLADAAARSASFARDFVTVSAGSWGQMGETVNAIAKEFQEMLAVSKLPNQTIVDDDDIRKRMPILVLHTRVSQIRSIYRERGCVAQLVTQLLNARAVEETEKEKEKVDFAFVALVFALGSKIKPKDVDRLIFVARPEGPTHRMIQRILEVKKRDSAHPLPGDLKEYLNDNWEAVHDEIMAALTLIVTAERRSEDRGVFVEKNCAFVPGHGNEEPRDEFAHVPGYGACALMETIERVLNTEYDRHDKLRATIVYGSHDREMNGEMNAMWQREQERKRIDGGLPPQICLESTCSLAARALASIRPDFVSRGYLDCRNDKVLHILERVELFAAVSTAEYAMTMRSSEEYKDTPDFKKRVKSFAVLALRMVKLLKTTTEATEPTEATTTEATEATEATTTETQQSKRHVIICLRRSNADEDLFSQVVRAQRLLQFRKENGARYDKLHLVTLDCVKGTVPVPIQRGRGRRRIFVVGREEAEIPLAWYGGPVGEEVGHAFVDEVVNSLVPEGRTFDVLVPCISRMCMPGAIDAFRNLFVNRDVRLFSWDMVEAGLAHNEFKEFFLGDDFRARVEVDDVRNVIEEIARGDRFWRFVMNFMLTIWARR